MKISHGGRKGCRKSSAVGLLRKPQLSQRRKDDVRIGEMRENEDWGEKWGETI